MPSGNGGGQSAEHLELLQHIPLKKQNSESEDRSKDTMLAPSSEWAGSGIFDRPIEASERMLPRYERPKGISHDKSEGGSNAVSSMYRDATITQTTARDTVVVWHT